MVPELDLFWRVAYWLVMGIAVLVSGLAAIILMIDRIRDARVDPEPRRSAIRSRLRQLPKSPPQ